MAYTYGGNGSHHLFIDGVPSDGMSELRGPINTTLAGVLLLGGHPNADGPDGGYVDDVRIYGRVLSAEEIAELAVPGDPTDDPGPPIPVGIAIHEMVGLVRTASQEGSVIVSWASIPGMRYELLWASDLTSGFSVIASDLVATGTEMSFTHPQGNAPVGFYTVRIQK